MQESVCLVVPCFNERRRLDLDAFRRFTQIHPVWFIFVDDGSTDGTAELIRPNVDDRVRLLVLAENTGKGHAVRHGVLFAQSLPLWSQVAWVGFWDADLATPLTELPKFFAFASACHARPDSIIGSRVSRLGARIQRRSSRHVLGRLFATAVSLILCVDAYDSQCGAKVIHASVVSRCFASPFVSRWLFDLEILLRLRGAVVVEYPLAAWLDVSGSKLRVFREVFRTARDLIQIWRHYVHRHDASSV